MGSKLTKVNNKMNVTYLQSLRCVVMQEIGDFHAQLMELMGHAIHCLLIEIVDPKRYVHRLPIYY